MVLIKKTNCFEDEKREQVVSREAASSSQEEDKLLTNFLSLPDHERIKIGHTFKDFVVSCSFEGNNCLNDRLGYKTN